MVPAAVWIPAVVALIVAVIAPFLTYQLGLNAQLKLTGKQKRQQAYSELMGEKAVLTQLIVSRFEAFINSDYHEARWKIAGQPKDSFDLQESQRWMRKSEDLAIEVAKSRKSLYDTLGLIRSYFPHSSRLKELTHRIYHSKGLEIKARPFGLNAAQLEPWAIKAVKEIQEIVENEYAKPIDDLVIYLEAEIDKEAGLISIAPPYTTRNRQAGGNTAGLGTEPPQGDGFLRQGLGRQVTRMPAIPKADGAA